MTKSQWFGVIIALLGACVIAGMVVLALYLISNNDGSGGAGVFGSIVGGLFGGLPMLITGIVYAIDDTPVKNDTPVDSTSVNE